MQPNRYDSAQVQSRETVFDAGLRAHFQRVYNIMALGLAITGFLAYLVAHTPALMQLFHGTMLEWVVIFAPLGIVFFGLNPARMQRMSVPGATSLFFVLSALFGISFATIFLVYSNTDIARVFFITAAMFAGTSIYGYTTKKDLSGIGSLMMMGLIGILIAFVVNIFLQSAMVHFVASIIGVIVFTGLTAWDTQNIKRLYHVSNGHEGNGKLAVLGALSLYLNFINLFMMLLNLLGRRD